MTEATTKAAVLTRRGAAQARTGHPWIYRSDIVVAAGVAGDVARVVDRGGRFLGRAFYNPESEISLRIFTREDEALDEAWLRNRIERAQNHYDALRRGAHVYRLLHAGADGIAGLVADRYGDYFVLQVGSAPVERRLAPIVAVLEDLFAPAGVLLCGDTTVRWPRAWPGE